MKAATSTSPIVFEVGDDPIKAGLVDNLNQPSANVTGAFFANELGAKRLALLRELVPAIPLAAVLVNPGGSTSRPDYERTMQLVENIVTKKGDKLGDRKIKSVTPPQHGKNLREDYRRPHGRLRQGEKAVALCRRAWGVVHRLHPGEFSRDVSNPWDGVTLKRRVKKKKPAVSRNQAYQFAWGCIACNRPEPAAAAVICFEWLQRPENVLAGARLPQ